MAGGVVSLLCWGLLGLKGACVDEQPRAADTILSRVDAGTISLSTPLRYYRQLRDEPEKLPCGVGYDIGLSGVDYEGAFGAAAGGLRVRYATHAGGPALMELHAGDSVSVLTQAKLPQMFRDEGAFDRRAYLAQQGIDLVATLRAKLLNRRDRVLQDGLRGRRALGNEIDPMWASQPRAAGVLRAMLLSNRSFVERNEATDFQKTGAFHVLVIPGPPDWLIVSILITLALLVICLRVHLSRHVIVTRSLCAALACATVLIATFPFAARTSAGKLEVSILDVGQGDS